MAVANTKSTSVTNADADKLTKLTIAGGRLRSTRGTVEVAAADDNDSVYRLVRVHSSWALEAIEVFNDAITSGATWDLGLYDTADNGGAAVDDDLFATDVSMTSARTTPTEMLFEALNIDKIEKQIWEQLGLSSDPNKYYDLCFKGQAVGSGAGTISVRVRYVDGT